METDVEVVSKGQSVIDSHLASTIPGPAHEHCQSWPCPTEHTGPIILQKVQVIPHMNWIQNSDYSASATDIRTVYQKTNNQPYAGKDQGPSGSNESMNIVTNMGGRKGRKRRGRQGNEQEGRVDLSGGNMQVKELASVTLEPHLCGGRAEGDDNNNNNNSNDSVHSDVRASEGSRGVCRVGGVTSMAVVTAADHTYAISDHTDTVSLAVASQTGVYTKMKANIDDHQDNRSQISLGSARSSVAAGGQTTAATTAPSVNLQDQIDKHCLSKQGWQEQQQQQQQQPQVMHMEWTNRAGHHSGGDQLAELMSSMNLSVDEDQCMHVDTYSGLNDSTLTNSHSGLSDATLTNSHSELSDATLTSSGMDTEGTSGCCNDRAASQPVDCVSDASEMEHDGGANNDSFKSMHQFISFGTCSWSKPASDPTAVTSAGILDEHPLVSSPITTLDSSVKQISNSQMQRCENTDNLGSTSCDLDITQGPNRQLPDMNATHSLDVQKLQKPDTKEVPLEQQQQQQQQQLSQVHSEKNESSGTHSEPISATGSKDIDARLKCISDLSIDSGIHADASPPSLHREYSHISPTSGYGSDRSSLDTFTLIDKVVLYSDDSSDDLSNVEAAAYSSPRHEEGCSHAGRAHMLPAAGLMGSKGSLDSLDLVGCLLDPTLGLEHGSSLRCDVTQNMQCSLPIMMQPKPDTYEGQVDILRVKPQDNDKLDDSLPHLEYKKDELHHPDSLPASTMPTAASCSVKQDNLSEDDQDKRSPSDQDYDREMDNLKDGKSVKVDMSPESADVSSLDTRGFSIPAPASTSTPEHSNNQPAKPWMDSLPTVSLTDDRQTVAQADGEDDWDDDADLDSVSLLDQQLKDTSLHPDDFCLDHTDLPDLSPQRIVTRPCEQNSSTMMELHKRDTSVSQHVGDVEFDPMDHMNSNICTMDRKDLDIHRSEHKDMLRTLKGDSRESTPSQEDPADLAHQMSQLHEMVHDMKESFGSAVTALTEVQYGDQMLQEKIKADQSSYDKQLADVVHMVISLKNDFGALMTEVHSANENQKNLHQKVEYLQYERDILLEELETAGVISEQVRSEYHSGKIRPQVMKRVNETPLSVLLDRARTAFQHHNNSSTSNTTSDQDSGVTTSRPGDLSSSCGEVTPPSVSPMVRSYIAGLQAHHPDVEAPAEDDYDSDSSLTLAANKSLDMSRSLGDRCADITHANSSDEEEGHLSDAETHDMAVTESEDSQAFSSPTENLPSVTKKIAPHEKNTKDVLRATVAREILETERKYCNCVWTILDHFAVPLKQANIVSAKEHSLIFPSCLYRIYEHHCAFLQRLEERLSNWRWQGVLGDVFSRFFDPNNCDLLNMYQAYVNDFPHSLHQIRKCCRNSAKFRKFIRTQQSDPVCEHLDLASFLLNPVQRVPRYVLLLKQLLRHTDMEHPDYYYIEMSLERLGAFLTELNDSIELSMKVVTGQATPKPRRKLRVGSFLSTSMGSYDAMVRENNHQSIHDISIISNTGSRFPGIDEHSSKPRPQLSSGFPRFEQSFSVPAQSAINTSQPLIFSAANGPCESQTLPSRGRRNKLRNRRSRSGDTSNIYSSELNSSIMTGSIQDTTFTETQRKVNWASSQCSVNEQVGSSRDISRPNTAECLSGESFRSQSSTASSPLRQHPDENCLPQRRNSRRRQSGDNFAASVKSLPEVTRQLSAVPASDEFGIYGDCDDVDESMYQSSMISETEMTRRMQMLGLRSRSFHDMHHKVPASPSQQQINMSLASSFTMDQIDPQVPTSTPVVPRPKSATGFAHPFPPGAKVSQKPPRPKSAVLSVSPSRPDQVKENVWEESMVDVSILNATTGTMSKRRGLIRKFRDKERSRKDEYYPNGDPKEKRKGFKDSIKNLFKKRKPNVSSPDEIDVNTSRVVELDTSRANYPDSNPAETSMMTSQEAMTTDDARMSDQVQTPPCSDRLTLSSVMIDSHDYEDENGDPCSAV